MADVFPELNLSTEERALLDAGDAEVEQWLQSAQTGDEAAREQLFAWAYVTARNYYSWKVQEKKHLTLRHADELTNSFFLEFEASWGKMKSVTHYSRRLLRNHWLRFVERQRRRNMRETPLHRVPHVAETRSVESDEPEWERWDDDELLQYQTVLQVLHESAPELKKIIAFRLDDPPLEYREIAQVVDLSETAIRMRVSRFYGSVRRRYQAAKKRNKTRYMVKTDTPIKPK